MDMERLCKYLAFALTPLRLLYFDGPAWSGWGFWEGRAPDDVCAELTHVDGSHWRGTEQGRMACTDLLERKFAAFVVGVAAVACVALAAQACSHFLTYHSTTKPLAEAIREIRERKKNNLIERRGKLRRIKKNHGPL